MSHLKNYYGTECPHCERMMPLIEKLEKELGVTVDKKEVWHDEGKLRGPPSWCTGRQCRTV